MKTKPLTYLFNMFKVYLPKVIIFDKRFIDKYCLTVSNNLGGHDGSHIGLF